MTINEHESHHTETESDHFWNTRFNAPDEYTQPDARSPDQDALNAALHHFGDVEGKTLIDVGCGSGKTSLFFAQHGANVIAIDSSQVAIDNLSRYCVDNGISNVDARVVRAQQIGDLPSADLLFGAMILHHIEPFADFVEQLRTVLKNGGKGFFYENSANSKLLVWFRRNLVGKFGVPKYGDDDEFPLTPDEVAVLGQQFGLRQVFPELFFFRMASLYLLRGRCWGAMTAVDNFFYRYPWIARYSYRQYLYIDDAAET